MELDHVLIAVADLDKAGQEIEVRHGLGSIEGGRHLAWGTANRIIPLGDSYLELIAMFDAAKAAESAVGRWVASGVSKPGGPLGWAVRTTELDNIAQRLHLEVHEGSRVSPVGEQLRWRTAGMDQAIAEPALPFFIEWAPGTKLPGQTPIRHPAGLTRITGLVLDGNPRRVAEWLGPHRLSIVVRPGKSALRAVHISSEAGEIVVGAD